VYWITDLAPNKSNPLRTSIWPSGLVRHQPFSAASAIQNQKILKFDIFIQTLLTTGLLTPEIFKIA
jgi:hypothetical protein